MFILWPEHFPRLETRKSLVMEKREGGLKICILTLGGYEDLGWRGRTEVGLMEKQKQTKKEGDVEWQIWPEVFLNSFAFFHVCLQPQPQLQCLSSNGSIFSWRLKSTYPQC